MEQTIEKMIRIVRGDTGGSLIYAEMLLSLLNRNYKVDLGYWCYKADRDDFETILEFMENYHNNFFEYEKLVQPYVQELKDYIGIE